MHRSLAALAAIFAAVGLAACGGSGNSTQNKDQQQVNQNIAKRGHAYIPHNGVEFNNYNRAQKVYDSPDTIIWCSTTWGNPSAPIVTIPIAGKLTSSSVSYFPGTKITWGDSGDSGVPVEQRSVDGMYHGSPPPYRYGFTPGGQYADFSQMPTLCTTALTKFQRQKTVVDVSADPAVAAVQGKAEAALHRGDRLGAQAILAKAVNGG